MEVSSPRQWRTYAEKSFGGCFWKSVIECYNFSRNKLIIIQKPKHFGRCLNTNNTHLLNTHQKIDFYYMLEMKNVVYNSNFQVSFHFHIWYYLVGSCFADLWHLEFVKPPQAIFKHNITRSSVLGDLKLPPNHLDRTHGFSWKHII